MGSTSIKCYGFLMTKWSSNPKSAYSSFPRVPLKTVLVSKYLRNVVANSTKSDAHQAGLSAERRTEYKKCCILLFSHNTPLQTVQQDVTTLDLIEIVPTQYTNCVISTEMYAGSVRLTFDEQSKFPIIYQLVLS